MLDSKKMKALVIKQSGNQIFERQDKNCFEGAEIDQRRFE